MRPMTPRAALAVAAACVWLVACAGAPSPSTQTGPLLPGTPDALPQLDAGGFATLLAQQRGTPVVVNLWAAWCTPCQEEAPLLRQAADRYGDVQFVGVDVQDDRSGAQTYIARYELPYPSVFDPTNAIGLSYDLYAPPATLFFNKDGTLVRTIPGQISEDDLRDGLRTITGPAE
jgi:cytochrome c biogenesis protein CcmG/thiol:disulfide interchange protein DsbE